MTKAAPRKKTETSMIYATNATSQWGGITLRFIERFVREKNMLKSKIKDSAEIDIAEIAEIDIA